MGPDLRAKSLALGIEIPLQVQQLADQVINRTPIVVMHESEIGTNAKCRMHWVMSEFEGKAENICSY